MKREKFSAGRNRQVVMRVLNGESYYSVAKTYKVTPVWIGVIFHREVKKLNKELYDSLSDGRPSVFDLRKNKDFFLNSKKINQGANMKAAILEISPEAFRQMFQIPKAARVVDVESDLYRHGVLQIKVVGVGPDVPDGACIQRFCGTISQARSADGDLLEPVIDWGLPDETLSP